MSYPSAVRLAFILFFAIGTSTLDAAPSPRVPFDALVTGSDAVVVGQVTGIATGRDDRTNGIYSYVTIDVDEVLKGDVQPGDVVIKQLGGTIGRQRVTVVGQAAFVVGEEVLLFLEARPRDGSLYTSATWQGKWSANRTADLIAQHDPTTGNGVTRGSLSAARAAIDRLWPANRTRAQALNVAPGDPRVAKPFTFYDPPVRFAEASVPVFVDTEDQPELEGGGIPEVLAAIAAWNGAGSGLTLVPASRVPNRCIGDVEGTTGILITFSDPCDEVSSDGNLVALTVLNAIDDPIDVNGETFFRIVSATTTTSRHPNATAILSHSGCFQTVITRELGIAIGLGYSDLGTVMSPELDPSCQESPLSLTEDDVLGIRTLYPGGSGAPGPGIPGAPGGPGAPIVTSVEVTGSILTITWTASTSGTATSHRLDFYAGIRQVLSIVVGASTSAVLPIPAGTLGTFAVTVTPLFGAAPGPTSTAFPFTIACAGPAAPNVTGAVASGTAAVAWAPVAGATSYIVQAGTSRGAANLFPPTNIGGLTSISASGLPAGFTAWVRVIAVGACGQGPPADVFIQ